MTELRFYFRKSTPGAYSIRQIFERLAGEIKRYRKVSSFELPSSSSSIRNLIINIRAARKLTAAGINHITGDAHYIALGISKGKIILTIHDCVLLSRTSCWNPKFWIYKWLWYDLPVWKADRITTISEKSKSDIIHYTGCLAEKIEVIPNFIDPAYQFQPKVFDPVCPRILHIGITPNKNLERVIKSLSGIPCILEVVGEVPKSIQELAQQNKVKLENCRNLPLSALVERYQAADMVVFASTYEGFGMPIVEAQAVGRPVVTSTLTPMPLVAGADGACFVNPFDEADIRMGILKVIENKDYRNRLIQRGLENIERFNLDFVVEQYLDLYDSILPNSTEKPTRLARQTQ